MNYAKSRQYRRLIGRLSKGEGVIASLERLCKRESIRAGTVTAIGLLSKVELQAYDPPNAYQTSLDAEGQFELIGLQGNISTLGGQTVINCYAHVATRHLGLPMAFGGRLYEGIALTVEFVVDIYDDLSLERRFDSRLGLPLLNKIETFAGESGLEHVPPPASSSRPASAISLPEFEEDEEPAASEPAPEPAPAPEEEGPRESWPRATAFTADGAAVTRSAEPQIVRRPSRALEPEADEGAAEPAAPAPSWGDAIQLSSRTREEKRLGISPMKKERQNLEIVNAWPEFPDIAPGDLLTHPHFGQCKVIYVEEDDFIRVRMRGGKVIDIKLEVCEIKPAESIGDQRVFTCTIVKR